MTDVTMENPTSSTVQSLNASGSSRVHVGNSYNITHHHGRGSEDEGVKKYLDALRSTDPRDDKARIEQTNGGLLKDSYVWILESPEFISWRDESKTGRLLWIRGDPGKGKTMLLCGLVNELQPLTRLDGSRNNKTISYFFCQATNSGLNNYTAILKGLIYLLIIQHPAAVSHLDGKEEKDHWNYKVSLEATLCKILDDPGLGETYLLVDALDECVEDLPLLLALISSTSSRAKWIATSRNRCEIEELFGEASSKLALSLELHEGSVSKAVESYVNYRTRQLAERKKLKKSSLQQIHDHLSENAHGTFLWVALVCQRLERCRAWEIPNQLSQFPQGLNQLYAKMMDQIHKSDSCDLYIRILAVASTVFRPLTFAELIAMESLEIDEETLPDLIVECGSFLTTKRNSVVFIHQSAKDFLLKESSTLLFQSGLAQHQYELFQKCIAMLKNLHQDIYGLVYPGVSLNEALRNCPDLDPLESIKYSCAFWADHMQEAYKLSIRGDEYSDIPGVDTVHDFINEKFLFWLEALALCQSIPAALKALVFLRDLPLPGQGSFRALVEDALRFSHYFCPIIESHPLQIYASGLLFSPDDSLIRRQFKQYTSKIFLKGPRLSNKWSPIRRIFECPDKDLDIKTMSFSPTSQTLVVSTSSTLTRWHVSQEPVPDVIERENSHNRITLSSDGNWLAVIVSRPGSEIAESSAQCELQVHDLGLSRVAWRQKLDSPEVLGMTISPDSQDFLVCYESLLVVYDSSGRIRRRYPLENTLPRLFHKPENEEIYFSFSSDCSWVAFHMRNWTQIWVLDLRTGKLYMNTPQNDTVHISDVKFIPGTYSLMFCDFVDNIYLWNVIEQKCEFWGHIQYSFSRLAVSHSDSWMVLCGDNGLIICDRASRRVRGFFDLPDLPDLQEIAISSDDQIIACGAEGGLWILDANTVFAEATTPRVYEKVLAFNNGRLIAYNFGHKIEVWDAATGCMLNLLIFDDMVDPKIRTITFSPMDRYLLVCGPQSIVGWDLTGKSWQKITGDFDGRPIAVSDKRRNGDRWVAACRSIREVSVWNTSTEQWIMDFRQPESQDWEVASIGFAGSQLGALWCPKGLSWGDSLFLLFNLRTGEQVSRIEISPRQMIESGKLLHLRKPRFKLSSSGTFVMIQPCSESSSFLWNLSSDGGCIEVCNKFQSFYFLDDLTVSTDQGIFHIGAIQSTSSQPPEKVSEVRVGMSKEGQNPPSRIYVAYSKYSKGLSGEWINFDNRPLLWRPAPYREEIIAIGHDYIILHINNSVDFIRFAKDADRVLCQAMRNLS